MLILINIIIYKIKLRISPGRRVIILSNGCILYGLYIYVQYYYNTGARAGHKENKIVIIIINYYKLVNIASAGEKIWVSG
jgi:hypothetical protein